MIFESWALIACKHKGLEIVPYGFEGGWVFVKNANGNIMPVGEDVVAKWIQEYKESTFKNEYLGTFVEGEETDG